MNNNYNNTDSEAQRTQDEQMFARILSRMSEQDTDGTVPQGGKSGVRQTIDLVELFYYLLARVHVIILGMVLGGVLLGLYAASSITPMYSATSKLYIMGTTGSSIIADLQIGSVLTLDYQEVFQTWEVHQLVNEELGTNYSYSTLQSLITVTNPEDTRVLYITARHSDAQTAADIANAYAVAAKKFIVQTMNTDEPSTFSIALVPSVSSGNGVTSYVIRGILLGTVLAGGILVLIFLLDNRPKSPEDIMRYANIPTLAVVPANPNLSGSKRKAGKS